jgi:hypothetical protein
MLSNEYYLSLLLMDILNKILNKYYRIIDNTKITDIFKFNIKNNGYISYSKLFKIHR